MSREIEIGDYIRTKYQGIKQVKKIEYDIDAKENYYYFDDLFGEWEHDIVKYSEDITELIETKDILKIKEDNSTVYVGLEKDETTVTYKDIIDDIKNGKIELLEILTYEQFEQNSYKVGV